MSDNNQQLSSAYESQLQDGQLSAQGFGVLMKATKRAAPRISANMGSSVLSTRSAQNAYVGMIVDDSGSIEVASDPDTDKEGPEMVVDAHNLVIDSLRGASSVRQSSTFVGTFLLNPDGQNAWRDPDDPNAPVNDFVALDSPALRRLVLGDTYRTSRYHLTPLPDRIIEVVAAGVAILDGLAKRIIDGRLELLVLTDGLPYGPMEHTEEDVKHLLESTREKVNVTLIGITQGGGTSGDNFTDFARRTGIQTVLTPKATEKEIRAAVNQFSSQAAGTASGQGLFGDSQQSGGW